MMETQVRVFACFILFFLLLCHSFFIFVHMQSPVFFSSLLVPYYLLYIFFIITHYWLNSSLHSSPCVVSDDRGFAESRVQRFDIPLSSSSSIHGADK